MDTSSDNYKSNRDTPSGTLPALFGIIDSLINRLIGLFTLTEDEKAKAGIYLGGEGRDYEQGDK